MINKRILPLFVFILIVLNVNSQILLEKDYSETALFAYLEGDAYYSADFVNNQCLIYGKDHILSKTVDLTVPTGMFLYDIAFLSRYVFNPDDLMELLVVYYNYAPLTDTSGYYYYTTQIVNENGTVLLDIPDGTYSYINVQDDGSLKLMVYLYDFSLSLYPTNTMIYGLPGDLSSSDSEYNKDKLQDPYPNPINNIVNIPYDIQNNKNAELILIDITGKELNNFTLNPNSKSIMINTSQLKAGHYIYYIETSGRRTLAKKIIVN